MIEVKLGLKTVDLPYQVRVYDVTEDMFDEMVEPDTRAELIDGVWKTSGRLIGLPA